MGAIQYCMVVLKTGDFSIDSQTWSRKWGIALQKLVQITLYFLGWPKALSWLCMGLTKNAEWSLKKWAPKSQGPWAIYDIYGNVLEWTYDQYDSDFIKDQPRKTSESLLQKLYPRVVSGRESFCQLANWKSAQLTIPDSPDLEANWSPNSKKAMVVSWSSIFWVLRLVRPLGPSRTRRN